MKIILILTLQIVFLSATFSQHKTVNGVVADAFSNKKLEYTKISISETYFTFTNSKGEFSISLNDKQLEDTIYIEAIGYEMLKMLGKELISKPIIYLQKIETIETIAVKTKKTKRFTKKIGDFSPPRLFPFPNCSHTTKNFDYLSYIPNTQQKEGFIERVYIRMMSDNNTYQIDPVTKKKLRFKNPEWIKIRIRCVEANADYVPIKDIVNENMIFIITRYKSQWIDISQFNVPFPLNGAFVGYEIIEYKERDGWGLGTVAAPAFISNKWRQKDYIFGKYTNARKKGFLHNGVEVSFEK
jgi:hypothetical protein